MTRVAMTLSRSRQFTKICSMEAAKGQTVRDSYRAHLRQRTLEAPGTAAAEVGWTRVRVGQVAVDIGVSRAMIYKEFGDKRGLGEALVVHEGERFLVGIEQVLAQHLLDVRAAQARGPTSLAPLSSATLSRRPCRGCRRRR